jgi:hypothetical protein
MIATMEPGTRRNAETDGQRERHDSDRKTGEKINEETFARIIAQTFEQFRPEQKNPLGGRRRNRWLHVYGKDKIILTIPHGTRKSAPALKRRPNRGY